MSWVNVSTRIQNREKVDFLVDCFGTWKFVILLSVILRILPRRLFLVLCNSTIHLFPVEIALEIVFINVMNFKIQKIDRYVIS